MPQHTQADATPQEAEKKRLSLKNIKTVSTQIAKDLRQLQKEHNTVPDILYNYKLQDGHLVRKRERAGSIAGSDVGDDDDEDARQSMAKDVKEVERKQVPAAGNAEKKEATS